MSQELSHRLRLLSEKQAALEALVSSPGWKVFEEEVEAQVRVIRQAAFCGSTSSLDGLVKVGSDIARAEGLRVAKALPDIILADLAVDIANLEEQIRQEEEGDTGVPIEGV